MLSQDPRVQDVENDATQPIKLIQPGGTKVAVLGATGYVGGRLVPRLLSAGCQVVAVSRSHTKLESRPWAQHAALALRSANVLDRDQLRHAIQDCECVYYLVHSMEKNVDFSSADRKAAENLAWAAPRAGVRQIIYLGGLGEERGGLSPHLQSRAEVGRILAQGAVPATVLRAAMIIGSGSASFEILRYLVDRLPVMITPRWVYTPSQPIAIRNVMNYLVGCLNNPATLGQTFDIGGPEVLDYKALMELYAEEAGLPPRWIMPVPVFSPKLSSYWIHLVTPVPAGLAQPLAEGLRNPAVCLDQRIHELLPQEILPCREAIRLALHNHLERNVESHWTDAGFLPPEETVHPGDARWSGGTIYTDRRTLRVHSSVSEVWKHILRIGGETGWYYGNTLWRIRGLIDKLTGGVGHERGRRDPETALVGDAVDFWRVLGVQPQRRLRLLAEMKLPGQAFLDFEVHDEGQQVTRIEQTARFVPSGLLGIAYWYAISPLHNLVFSGMLRGIAKAARGKIIEGPTRQR